MANDKIYGTLDTLSVELPPETPEEAERLRKQNEELKGLGVRTYRGGTDYAFREYKHMYSNMSHSEAQRYRKARPPRTRFESGDLVRVFKTVTDGDVLWQGRISYETKRYHHGLQRGVPEQKWAHMFYDRLPARLEKKDGTVLYGALDPFAETGTEGVIWSVHEYGKRSYDGLNCLENGDKLTVYSCVRDGAVEWEGPVDFTPQKITKVGWTEVLREAKHMDADEWLHMCYQNRPVAVTPRAPKL